MQISQNVSDPAPAFAPDVQRLAWEAQRRAEAMGLAAAQDAESFELAAVKRLARKINEAGIARTLSRQIAHAEEASSEELAELLSMLLRALEESPVPQHEWRALSGVFETEQLARLLNISVSSLRRYQSGTRATPDDIAARLHFIALVVGDLSGTYNDIGIRRWFDRSRTRLNRKRPSSVLSGDWTPEDPGPQRVRELGRSLVTLSGT